MRRILFVFISVVLFFGATETLAFGHPDTTVLDIEFQKPEQGTPFNPDLAGLVVSFNVKDVMPPTKDTGGEIASCELYTKNGGTDLDTNWTKRGTIPGCAGSEAKEVKTVITSDMCSAKEAEGTARCGVRIKACDSNSRCVQEERFFTVDATPPKTIEISSNRSDPTNQTDVEFTFRASDPYGISGFHCKLDTEKDFSPCASPKIYSRVSDGRRTFTVKAFDVAGNFATSSLAWEVDSTPPSKIEGALILDANNLARDSDGFSENPFAVVLRWTAPREFGVRGDKASQYDIRYIRHDPSVDIASDTADLTARWETATAFVLKEFEPDPPGRLETTVVGPPDNPLISYTSYLFGIRSRDELWNWSGITTFPVVKTQRDLCDYDADRIFSPNSLCGKNACNPKRDVCDLYDNPFDWILKGDWNPKQHEDHAPEGIPWIRKFAQTIKDLDEDGYDVAAGRTGLSARLEKEFPPQEGKDWYDNFFTKDFVGLAVLPTLAQLSHTINDLDLDTFVSKSWKEKIGFNEYDEPDDADVRGCVYPSALEATCLNCTAYTPDSATGRIPSGKTKASTNESRAVCQIEAYYTKFKGKAQPYEVIKEGTLDLNVPLITASAQCRDGVDNNLNGTKDSGAKDDLNRERTCPTTFEDGVLQSEVPRSVDGVRPRQLSAAIFEPVGLVRCGRDADDFNTPADESAPCGFCHSASLIDRLFKLVLFRLMPLLIGLTVVGAGFLIVISAGRSEQIVRAKNLVRIAVIAYAATLLFWTLLSVFFSVFGISKWTGLQGGWWQFACDIAPGLEANFSASPQGGIAPFRVDFTDLSGGDISKWSWDFDNDGVEDSVSRSPSFTYTTNGPHTVKLTVAGKAGTAVKTDAIYFAPTADFIAAPLRGRAPLAVSFNSSLSRGQITTWLWDFGDPKSNPYHTSADQNSTHTYERPGSYVVKLTSSGPGGKDTKTKLNYAYVYPPPPQPLVDFDGGRIIETLWAEFKNRSLLSSPPFGEKGAPQDYITSWSWDLDGDGTFDDSRAEHPTYFYRSRDKPYTVSLKANGPGGTSDPKERVDYIAFPPQADFSAIQTSGSLPKSGPFSVNFQDASTGTISGWEWNFGDGTTDVSNNPKPSHGYLQNGRFTIGLKAKGPEEPGEDFLERDSYIAVAPFSDFEFSSVALSDPTPQPPSQHCVSDDCTVGTSGATVTFTPTGSRCVGDCRTYWQFGDGGEAAASGLIPATHRFESNDTYPVRLTVTASGGSNLSQKDNYVNIAPYAEFSPRTRQSFQGQCSANVNFSDESRVNREKWLWDFQDGSQSTQSSPSHNFSANSSPGNGCFDVAVQVDGPGGRDTETKKDLVTFVPIARVNPQTSSFSNSITLQKACGAPDPPAPSFCQTVTISDASDGESCIPHGHSWSNGTTLSACVTSGSETVSTTLTESNSCGEKTQTTASLTVSQTVSIQEDPCPPPPAPSLTLARLPEIRAWLVEFFQ